MTIATAPEIEAIVDRFLLPSAPPELVDAVRERLSKGDLEVSGAAAGSAGPQMNGSSRGPTRVRDPWRLLHVVRGAPQAVVDIAYDFWRADRDSSVPAPAPRVATTSASRPSPSPTPPAPPEPDPAGADDRVAQLATAVEEPRPLPNGTADDRAFVETEDGQRFGITEHPLRIGAGVDCDVVLPQDGPLEARIWTHGDRYMLRAVVGRVRAGGARVTLVVLDDGDILEIGHATFRFRLNEHH